MCKLTNFFKGKSTAEKPAWVTQSRREVAKAELEAASVHLTWQKLIEAGDYPDNTMIGSKEHHEYWCLKHQEAAWYTDPEYTEARVAR